MGRHASSAVGLIGLVLGLSVVAWAHVSMGGSLDMFLQGEALAVVAGGTLAALLVSFPPVTLGGSVAAVLDLFLRPARPLDMLVPAFMAYARTSRRDGPRALEAEIALAGDEFLERALSLSVSGLSGPLVRETLEIDARVCSERDEEAAEVLEAAAGYAPTLGIVGAVLGLMHVMQNFGAAAGVGAGIGSAFVATVYGVGAANLIFLPLATRLRARCRREQLRRELVIDGVLALRDGATPGVVEDRLAGYLPQARSISLAEVA